MEPKPNKRREIPITENHEKPEPEELRRLLDLELYNEAAYYLQNIRLYGPSAEVEMNEALLRFVIVDTLKSGKIENVHALYCFFGAEPVWETELAQNLVLDRLHALLKDDSLSFLYAVQILLLAQKISVPTERLHEDMRTLLQQMISNQRDRAIRTVASNELIQALLADPDWLGREDVQQMLPELASKVFRLGDFQELENIMHALGQPDFLDSFLEKYPERKNDVTVGLGRFLARTNYEAFEQYCNRFRVSKSERLEIIRSVLPGLITNGSYLIVEAAMDRFSRHELMTGLDVSTAFHSRFFAFKGKPDAIELFAWVRLFGMESVVGNSVGTRASFSEQFHLAMYTDRSPASLHHLWALPEFDRDLKIDILRRGVRDGYSLLMLDEYIGRDEQLLQDVATAITANPKERYGNDHPPDYRILETFDWFFATKNYVGMKCLLRLFPSVLRDARMADYGSLTPAVAREHDADGDALMAGDLVDLLEAMGKKVEEDLKKRIQKHAQAELRRREHREPRSVDKRQHSLSNEIIQFYLGQMIDHEMISFQHDMRRQHQELPMPIAVELEALRNSIWQENQTRFRWIREYLVCAVASELISQKPTDKCYAYCRAVEIPDLSPPTLRAPALPDKRRSTNKFLQAATAEEVRTYLLRARERFTAPDWSASYGGAPWADIAQAALKMWLPASSRQAEVWIDHVFDLEHHNGMVFDKDVMLVRVSGDENGLLQIKFSARSFNALSKEFLVWTQRIFTHDTEGTGIKASIEKYSKLYSAWKSLRERAKQQLKSTL